MLGRVPAFATLALGPEGFLAERVLAEAVASARAAEPDIDVRDLSAGTVEPGALALLASPALFGAGTLLVLRDAHDLPAAVHAEVGTVLGALAEDLRLVASHAGGAKGKAVAEAIRAAGATVVECPKLTSPNDLLDFVRGELRRAGRRIDEEAARTLLDAVGRDLRELAAACAQLVADAPDGQRIDVGTVRTYYAGRAEVSGFAVADAAVEGRVVDALQQVRWALAVGVAPVLVTSALAGSLRGIARAAETGRSSGDLARALGMPAWKARRVQQQARGWTPDCLAQAVQAVAAADAAVKGAEADPAYALERAVVAVATLRQARGRRS